MVEKMNTTIDGLADTALEKILSLGFDEAKEEVERIRDMIEDLINFWGLDSGFLIEFDKMIEVCE